MARTNKRGYFHRLCKGEHCGCKTAHSYEHDYATGKMVMKCYNCGKLTPVVKRAPKVNAEGLTAAQEKAIARFKERLVLAHYGSTADSYEIKEFEVKITKYDSGAPFVSVVAETGSKGDEGTYGSIFCRRRVHLSVGPRGAAKVLNYKKGQGPSKWGGWWDAAHAVVGY